MQHIVEERMRSLFVDASVCVCVCACACACVRVCVRMLASMLYMHVSIHASRYAHKTRNFHPTLLTSLLHTTHTPAHTYKHTNAHTRRRQRRREPRLRRIRINDQTHQNQPSAPRNAQNVLRAHLEQKPRSQQVEFLKSLSSLSMSVGMCCVAHA